jgi:Mn2+/Fe2+ NRAMP family transporter
VTTFVGILGTTISPYLFFWQASQEVEEERAKGRRTGEWVTEPDPRGRRPATGPARHTRLPLVNNAG